MNTPTFSFNGFSSWINHHKTLFSMIIAVLVWCSTYFATAQDLEKTRSMAEENAKVNRIQDLTYHIDILSKIKKEDRPQEIQRALDNYIEEKRTLLKANP